jgi:hypothetical protein
MAAVITSMRSNNRGKIVVRSIDVPRWNVSSRGLRTYAARSDRR